MAEDYALFILKREQQILYSDTQLRGPGLHFQHDPRIIQLESLGSAINLLKKKSKKSGQVVPEYRR